MQNEAQAKILYGVCQRSMPPLTPTVAAQTLVELGLDGIELDAGGWDGAQLGLADRDLQQQWLAACDQSALQIPALGVNALCNDGMSKSHKCKIVQAILSSGVAIAHELKIPVLQLPSFFDGAINCRQLFWGKATVNSQKRCLFLLKTNIAGGLFWRMTITAFQTPQIGNPM